MIVNGQEKCGSKGEFRFMIVNGRDKRGSGQRKRGMRRDEEEKKKVKRFEKNGIDEVKVIKKTYSNSSDNMTISNVNK